MNMIVSAAAFASATPAAAAVSSHPDQHLLDLARQLSEGMPAKKRAYVRCCEAFKEFERRKPDRSCALVWKPGDPVGYEPNWRFGQHGLIWCDAVKIHQMRDMQMYDWSLKPEQEAVFDALDDNDRLFLFAAPQEHVQHHFSKKPSRIKQRRLDELVKALDEHNAECSALKKEIGLHEADREYEALYIPLDAIADEATDIAPVTLAGFQAKARVLLEWYWADDDLNDHDPVAVDLVKGLAELNLASSAL
jgi:hypothetical protein